MGTKRIFSAFIACFCISTANADLIVNSTTGPGTIDTSGGPVTVTLTLSLHGLSTMSQPASSELSNGYTLTFELQPNDGNVDFSPAISTAPGSPANSSFNVFALPSNTTVTGANAKFSSTQNIGPGGTPVLNVSLTFDQGVYGQYDLVLVPGPTLETGSHWLDESDVALPFANVGATLTTITAVPEASSFIFCGVVSSLGGFVAWRRRRAQAAA